MGKYDAIPERTPEYLIMNAVPVIREKMDHGLEMLAANLVKIGETDGNRIYNFLKVAETLADDGDFSDWK